MAPVVQAPPDCWADETMCHGRKKPRDAPLDNLVDDDNSGNPTDSETLLIPLVESMTPAVRAPPDCWADETMCHGRKKPRDLSSDDLATDTDSDDNEKENANTPTHDEILLASRAETVAPIARATPDCWADETMCHGRKKLRDVSSDSLTVDENDDDEDSSDTTYSQERLDLRAETVAPDTRAPPDCWADETMCHGKRSGDVSLDSLTVRDSNDYSSMKDAGVTRDGLLVARQASSSQQQPIIVPGTYIGSDPGANSGEVAGIVLGVVFGICVVLWILSSLVANPFRPVVGTSSVTDGGRHHRSDRRSRTTRTKSTGRRTTRSVSREEMSEYVTSGHRRERGGGGGRSPRRARETIVVEESRRESRPPPPRDEYVDDDVVEVIEEESDISPAGHGRRVPGYRHVDPDEYGGGGRPTRKVRR